MAKLRTFVAGIALAVLFAAPAAAQTISYQQAVGELGAACGADIGKFCKGINLGNGLGECMQKNEARVSQNCKTTFAATMASLDKRAAAQAAVPQLCASDIKRLCKEYDPGNGRILRCLLKFNDKVHANCNQAITDAGWR
ncbi:cysteine rich repeat-containing protein [Microbaculum marinum]|uniref:Cysteine rich repeat-containing protein n=1 Tax=Microbaculum marinum TaxID=1764581 RepID=A0AAW9RLG0_9HYPH